MEREKRNVNCALYGTRYCDLLNIQPCTQCSAADRDPDEVIRELALYERLLPEGGVAPLFQSRVCTLCKRERPGKRNGYAILAMAHPAPKGIQMRRVGNRKVSEFGTMIPLQFAICADCRRRLLLMQYLPVALPLITGILALAVLANERVVDALTKTARFLPFFVWAGAMVLAAAVGLGFSHSLRRRFARVMYVDILEHPVVREMMQMGWIPLERQNRSKLVFSKSRLIKGLGTAADDGGESESPEFAAQNGKNV